MPSLLLDGRKGKRKREREGEREREREREREMARGLFSQGRKYLANYVAWDFSLLSDGIKG
jgi:hypothetical protein